MRNEYGTGKSVSERRRSVSTKVFLLNSCIASRYCALDIVDLAGLLVFCISVSRFSEIPAPYACSTDDCSTWVMEQMKATESNGS